MQPAKGAASSSRGQLVRHIVASHLRALALNLRLGHDDLPGVWAALALGLHSLGLLALARLTRQTWWMALIPVLALQPALAAVRRRPWRAYLVALAPLGLAYCVALIRMVGRRISPGWAPTAGWLNLDYLLTLAALWALTAQAGLTIQLWRPKPAPEGLLGVALCTLALVWSTATGLTLHTRGVTGTDPYAYAQMGVDLARHGTPEHVFPLVPLLAGSGVPLHPLVPVGYGIPNATTGIAATVWPPGQAALLALGYRVGGETGLYMTTPVLGLLALLALWWLAHEALHAWPPAARCLAGGVAVALLATSFEQVDRQLTPMADIPAQLFSVLALCCALVAARTQRRRWAALAGLCLGMAFDLRYTQLLLAPALALLLTCGRPTRSWRAIPAYLALCAGAALLSAAPVLWYHQVAFGGPFTVGSKELALFSWDALRRTLPRMASALAQAREYRYALPLAVLGFVQLWCRDRRTALALTAAFGLVTVVQLPYQALRLRDLLPVLPILALWAGTGLSGCLGWIGRHVCGAPRHALQACGVLLCALLVYSDATLLLPVPPWHHNAFGFLTGTQRASLDSLAEATPPDAVVAASLNAGAITLYAQRDIVRPGAWSQVEWLAVAERLLAAGRPLYLLVDGEEMRASAEALEGPYDLVPLGVLSLPYFFPGGGSENRDVPLYRVAPRGG